MLNVRADSAEREKAEGKGGRVGGGSKLGCRVFAESPAPLRRLPRRTRPAGPASDGDLAEGACAARAGINGGRPAGDLMHPNQKNEGYGRGGEVPHVSNRMHPRHPSQWCIAVTRWPAMAAEKSMIGQ